MITSPAIKTTPTLYTPEAVVRLLGLTSLIIPLLYWPPAFDAAGLPREALIAVCAGLGLLLFSAGETRKAAYVNWHPVTLLLLLLLTWGIASYFWSVDQGSSLLGILQFSSLIVIALLASQLSTDALQHYILPLALIAATLVGLIGIAQHLGFDPLAFRQLAPPASTFVNRNYASNYFDLLTPMAFVYLLLQTRPANHRTLLGASAFTACLGYLVIAQTRGSWLGLLVAVIGFAILIFFKADIRRFILERMRVHKWALIVSVTIIIALGFTESRVQPISGKLDAVTSLTPDYSINLRLQIYKNSIAGFTEQPWLGVGYGAFINGFSPYVSAVETITKMNQNRIIQYLHSDPLQMFFELGLPGGLLSLAIYLLVIYMAWQIARSGAPLSQRLAGTGLLLALLASGAHAWIDFPLRLPSSAFFFWLWSGFVIGLYLQIFPQKRLKLSQLAKVLAGIAGLLFAGYTGYLYAGYLQANRDVRMAMINAMQNNCPEVYRLSDGAMNSFGIDHLTQFWYAKVYTYCDAPIDKKLLAMNRVLTDSPNMPLPYLTRARIMLEKNRLTLAADDFNRFRTLLPHLPDGYHGLGLVALRLNNREQALFWLEQALSRAPNDKQIQLLLSQIEETKPKEMDEKVDK